MKGTRSSNVPFRVARSDPRTLVDQVEAGLRKAIATGRYRAGSVLPSTQEMADALHVSRIVTRHAYRRLIDDGTIASRVGVGCFVSAPECRSWRGHVLGIATCSFENLLQNCLMNGLMERLSSSGYIFSQVSVCDFDAGTCDFSQLDIELAHGIDFVCVLGAGRLMDAICGHLSKLRVPFAVLGADTGMRTPRGGSAVPLDYDMAVPGFVGACLSHGIRSVLQVSFSHQMANAIPALRKAGLRAREMFLEDSGRWEDGDVVGTQYMAMTAFDKMLKSGRPLPDLVFFADDHLAAGALTALLANGVRVPQDVSVATWSNRLSRPVFPVPLARMEVDVVAAGSVAADAVLAYLKTGVFPSGVAFGPAWVDGASIAVKTADCGKTEKENRHEDN